ncbi:MAG: hypothetical protein E4G99_11955 [Anaerolineales bacterium]|nr:MAG: hypothetical protein E4G99_11955 [Anaerolineales bacterium]
MTQIGITREISKISPTDAFQETLEALPDLGYVIWKTRPMAWLIIANRELPEGKINATVSFRPSAGAVLSVSLASETIAEAPLQTLALDLTESLVSTLGLIP